MSANQKIASLMRTLGLPSTPNVITQFKNLLEGGCDDFTLTVEALAFVDPGLGDDRRIIASAANQEYFLNQEEGVESVILPWITLPEESIIDDGLLPSLNIKTDRSCCQDAIQISLVGEDIKDLAEYVPLNFEVPAGESAIMIPFGFSFEAPLGPKIIGVQAIGCGQNKIKDLYFEYIDPDAFECPESIDGSVTVYNSFGTWFDLYFYSEIGGDYDVTFYVNGKEVLTTSGYTSGQEEQIKVNVSSVWDPTAAHSLNIRFKPYEFSSGIACDDYCNAISGIGSFSESFSLSPCELEPYYGMSAIGEDVVIEYTPPAK